MKGIDTTRPERGGERAPMTAHGITHKGKRSTNEDRHLVREDLGLAILADGFSGGDAGDLAATLTVDQILRCFDGGTEQTLPELPASLVPFGLAPATVGFAFDLAHRHVRKTARARDAREMRAAAGLLLFAGPRVVVAAAGCVCAYRLRRDRLERMAGTHEPPTEARYPLGGTAPILSLHLRSPEVAAAPATWGHGPGVVARVEAWCPGDVYLLASKGLHEVLGEDAILSALTPFPGVAARAAALLGATLHARATDDVTIVVASPRTACTPGTPGHHLAPKRSEP